MALTMTRNRTQTTLTKLVQKLGEVKGELEFVESWMEEAGAPAELSRRREMLLARAQALTMTLQQFDAELNVGRVAALENWRKVYRTRTILSLRNKYLRAHWLPGPST
ncbi:hypothetical protein [Diaphorobacter sp.]|uniref:hypothetical protein n=1 Tax=Diaphorobacter sp. TaxID=1934310 RepID=UPI002585589E|nr:hypothetical protein [Diaphorobacter sp.]